MKRSILIIILFVNYTVSLKVISSFTDFETASNANIKGTPHRNRSHQLIEDLSLCFRFLAFFKQKATLGFNTNIAWWNYIQFLNASQGKTMLISIASKPKLKLWLWLLLLCLNLTLILPCPCLSPLPWLWFYLAWTSHWPWHCLDLALTLP